MNYCCICNAPLPKSKGRQATTCPGACRHERNKRLWKANAKKRRSGYNKDDGLAQAREWLKRANKVIGERGL